MLDSRNHCSWSRLWVWRPRDNQTKIRSRETASRAYDQPGQHVPQTRWVHLAASGSWEPWLHWSYKNSTKIQWRANVASSGLFVDLINPLREETVHQDHSIHNLDRKVSFESPKCSKWPKYSAMKPITYQEGREKNDSSAAIPFCALAQSSLKSWEVGSQHITTEQS